MRRKIRVLIIDDERDFMAALGASFSAGRGFVLETAEDGEEGLRKAQSFQPDVAVMDVQMPGMDGWETARRFRCDPRTAKLPIVIMTAFISDELLRRARLVRASRVLLKLLDGSEFLEAVREAALGRNQGASSPPLLTAK